AEVYGIKIEEDLSSHTLNNVVCHILHARDDTVLEVASKLCGILESTPLTPPKALEQLAAITDFRLFITTTFDSLLEDTLKKVRFKGQPGLRSLAYVPNDGEEVKDLDPVENDDPPTTVYYLMGKLSDDYVPGRVVIRDDDLLEFVCHLQLEDKRPRQ